MSGTPPAAVFLSAGPCWAAAACAAKRRTSRAFRCFGDAVDQARAELLCVSGRPGSHEEISRALAARQRHGRYANMGPPKLASGTLRNPAGMVTPALAMLPGVGGSKRMSSRTVPRRGLPTTAWLQLLQ